MESGAVLPSTIVYFFVWAFRSDGIMGFIEGGLASAGPRRIVQSRIMSKSCILISIWLCGVRVTLPFFIHTFTVPLPSLQDTHPTSSARSAACKVT